MDYKCKSCRQEFYLEGPHNPKFCPWCGCLHQNGIPELEEEYEEEEELTEE